MGEGFYSRESLEGGIPPSPSSLPSSPNFLSLHETLLSFYLPSLFSPSTSLVSASLFLSPLLLILSLHESLISFHLSPHWEGLESVEAALNYWLTVWEGNRSGVDSYVPR